MVIINNLDNEDLIYDLYKANDSYKVKVGIIEKISNNEKLKHIYEDTKNANIRKVIVDKISDEKILKEIGENDSVWEIRVIANEKIGNIKEVLHDILNNTTDSKLFYDTYKESKNQNVPLNEYIENKKFFMDTLLIPYEKTLRHYMELEEEYHQKGKTSEKDLAQIKENQKLCREQISKFKEMVNDVSKEGKDKTLTLALSQENFETHKVVVELSDDKEILQEIADDDNEFPEIRQLAKDKLILK